MRFSHVTLKLNFFCDWISFSQRRKGKMQRGKVLAALHLCAFCVKPTVVYSSRKAAEKKFKKAKSWRLCIFAPFA